MQIVIHVLDPAEFGDCGGIDEDVEAPVTRDGRRAEKEAPAVRRPV